MNFWSEKMFYIKYHILSLPTKFDSNRLVISENNKMGKVYRRRLRQTQSNDKSLHDPSGHVDQSCSFEIDINNVREYRRGNQKWTIQRKYQHWVHKTQDEDKQNKNTFFCVLPYFLSLYKYVYSKISINENRLLIPIILLCFFLFCLFKIPFSVFYWPLCAKC